MALTLTASAGGSGPLVRAIVAPFVRENVSARGSIVQCMDSGVAKVSTDARLRMSHLIAPDSTSSRVYRAGAQDTAGLWSEWSSPVTLSASNFSASTLDGSIGSGATTSLEIEEPSVLFPDLSIGSGIVETHRTLVGEGFADELRRSAWEQGLAVFKVLLIDMDDWQAELLRAFYRDLNGPFRPFYFDWQDPTSGIETRYVVRFREDPTNDLADIEMSDATLTFVEVAKAAGGGDV